MSQIQTEYIFEWDCDNSIRADPITRRLDPTN